MAVMLLEKAMLVCAAAKAAVCRRKTRESARKARMRWYNSKKVKFEEGAPMRWKSLCPNMKAYKRKPHKFEITVIQFKSI